MDPSTLLKGRTRETDIRRDARGRWFNGTDPITHESLVKALDGWIARADDGRYCLHNSVNWAYFDLEGFPYEVRGVSTPTPESVPTLHLSGGHSEPLVPETLRIDDDGRLCCLVRDGLEAVFGSQAQFEMGTFLQHDEPPTFEIAGVRVVAAPRSKS